jgi:cytochrome P450
MELWKENTPIEINESMNNITLEIILKAGFGYNLVENMKIGEFSFKENIKIFLDSMIYMFLTPSLIRSFLAKLPWQTKEKKCLKCIEDFGAYVDEIIKSHKNSIGDRYDLLSLLLTSKDEESVLTHQEVKSDSFIFLLAGHDTTSSQLSWTLYELAKNPEIQQTLFEEISQIQREKEPSLADYENLKYTSWVVNESLRLHPPVQGILKQNVNRKTFKGEKYDLTVDPMEYFLINIQSLHTDPRYWDDPMKFNPERWSKPLKNTCAYLPFSLGPRKCIGLNFSLIESNIILATILNKFSVHLADENYIYQSQMGIVDKPNDLKLIFKKR